MATDYSKLDTSGLDLEPLKNSGPLIPDTSISDQPSLATPQLDVEGLNLTPLTGPLDTGALPALESARPSPKLVLESVINTNPQKAAQANQYAREFNVPITQVEADFDRYRIQSYLNQLNVDRNTAPVVSKYIERPDLASMVHDDIPALVNSESAINNAKTGMAQYFADISEAWDIGKQQVAASEVGAEWMLATIADQEFAGDIEGATEILNNLGNPAEDYGFFAGAPIPAVQTLPALIEIVTAGIETGAEGAVYGAGTGAVIGSIFPGLGTVAGATQGGLLGGSYLYRFGSGGKAFIIEGGQASIEFRGLVDEKGNRLDPKIAAYGGVAVGAVNAALEYLSVAIIGSAVNQSVKTAIRYNIRKALQTESGRQAVQRIAIKYAELVGKEAGIEGLQEFVNVAGGEIAKFIDTESFKGTELGDAVDNIFSMETAERVGGAVYSGAQAGLVFGAPSTIVNTASYVASNKQTQHEKEQAQLDQIIDAVAVPKLRENDVEQFRQFIDEVDGEDPTQIYLDGSQTALYLRQFTDEQINNDPALSLLKERIGESQVLDTPVSVDLADFAAKVVGSQHIDTLRDTMSLSADTPSRSYLQRDIQARDNFIANLRKTAEIQAQKSEELSSIYEEVQQKLVDSGRYSAEQSKSIAQVVPAYVAQIAARTGKGVREIYDEMGLDIQGPMTGEKARLERELSGIMLDQPPAYRDAIDIYETVRDDFLTAFPEDALFDEVMDNIEDMPAKYKPLLRALDEADWLGFEYPSQALDAIMSEEVDNYDLPQNVKAQLGRLVNGKIFEQAGVMTQEAVVEERRHQIPMRYIVKTRARKQNKPSVVKALNERNLEKQDTALDKLADQHPSPLDSDQAWINFERALTGDTLVPPPPYRMISLFNDMDAWINNHSRMSKNQISAAAEGFRLVEEFKSLYQSGQVDAHTTGKLMLWGMLSRMLSTHPHESAFIDAATKGGLDDYIQTALDREWTDTDVESYLEWVTTVIPDYAPGKQGTSNMNDFGKVFLKKMSKRMEDGRSALDHLHEMIADPTITTAQIRRRFYALAGDVGIKNKVLSFVLLLTGRDDVVVLDRIQINTMWDTARYGKLMYDDVASLFDGAQGLARYEALERSLLAKIDELYAGVGRPEDASVGRYHWESWVLNSGQVVAHPTIQSLIDQVKGFDKPFADIGAPEGRYHQYSFGSIYAKDADGTPYIVYNDSEGNQYRFGLKEFKDFLAQVKKPATGVVPPKFSVKTFRELGYPWYEAQEVNRERLDELIREQGERLARPLGEGADTDGARLYQRAGDGRGRDTGRGPAPLEGAPSNFTGPIPDIVNVAEAYAASIGLDYNRQGSYARVDPERGARIAQAYAEMEHNPNDPVVKEAFDNLINQTLDQYQALVDAGYTFSFFDESTDPYQGNPWNAMRDLRDNKTMAVYGTYAGYGTEGITVAAVDDNPMLRATELVWLDQNGVERPVLANDVFRAVHDAFGHGVEGSGFRAQGEENAWQAHIRLFTGSAKGAITSETRGQNSWLNFGPYGEQNQTAAVEDTVFADQKTGLMPEWTWSEGIVDDMPRMEQGGGTTRGYYDPNQTLIRLTESSDLSTFLHEFAHFMLEMERRYDSPEIANINSWFLRNVEDVAAEANGYVQTQRDQLEQPAFHGTPHRFDRFSLDAIGTGEGAQAYGWGLYFAGNRGVAEWYRNKLSPSTLLIDGNPIELPVDQFSEKDIGILKRGIYAETKAMERFVTDNKLSDDEAKKAYQEYVDDSLDIDYQFTYADDRDGLQTWVDANLKGKEHWFSSDGSVYQVDLPEDDVLLDWDAPFSEQPEFVKDGLKETLADLQTNIDDLTDRLGITDDLDAITGGDFYRMLTLALEEGYLGDNGPGVERALETGSSDRAASLYLSNELIRGLRYLDATSRGAGEGSRNYVIWDEDVVTVEAVNDELRQAEILAQGDVTQAEGDITAQDVVNFIETGTSGDQAKDSAINRSMHEQFARGYEAYLMEGKAPTVGLRNAFRKFAAWMTQIYKSIKAGLRVNLDEDMREVFNRLMASEEQIELAKARQELEPMFTDQAMSGMTDAEWEAYQNRINRTSDVAKETLRDKLIKELTRQSKQWWNDQLEAFYEVELARTQDDEPYASIESIRNNDELKLDRAKVKELVGETKTDKRGRTSTRAPRLFNGMTQENGVDPDLYAEELGYESGEAMLKAWLAQPPKEQVARERAEQKMLEKHGDMLNDGTIEKEAERALVNEERGKLILQEFKALNKKAGKPNVERQAIKDLAQQRIDQLTFRQLDPKKYRAGELRAARDAGAALAKGDYETAAAAKMRQAVNYEMWMAATEAKENTGKMLTKLARYRKKAVVAEIAKAGEDYWDQMAKILDRFEFRKGATLKQVEDINTWVRNKVESMGEGIILDPVVLDEGYRKHWKDLSYREMKGVFDSLRNIEHVAKYTNQIDVLGEKVDYETLVADLVQHIRDNTTNPFPAAQRTTVEDMKEQSRWRQSLASMTKIPFLVSWLDGGERASKTHDVLTQPFSDAQAKEFTLWREVGTKVMELIANRSKADIKRHIKRVLIKEIQDDQNDGYLTGGQILAVALNTGNQGNLEKMLRGEGWITKDDTASFDNPQLQAVLKHMTKSDWELVQAIWDQMEMLYPQLAEVHRKTTGITPPQVKPVPVDTPFGQFRGGYYPVVYDRYRSQKADENQTKSEESVDSLFNPMGMGIQSSVTAGATNERTKFYDKIRFSLDVVPNHFQETIHYIAFHDAVRQTNKLIRDGRVKRAIVESVGIDEYNLLRPWLNAVAKDGREARSKQFFEAFMQRLRIGSTVAMMGFKASTLIMQTLGLSNIVAETGLKNTLMAFKTILANEKSMAYAWEYAREKSNVLEFRVKTFDREVANAIRSLEGKNTWFSKAQQAAMAPIAYIQLYTVDLPTWYAAYHKEMGKTGDEAKAVRYADWAVENIQGSGLVKDAASIMREKNELYKAITMFMTYFSALFNSLRDIKEGVTRDQYNTPDVAARLTFFILLPVILEMLMKDEIDTEDDEAIEKVLAKIALYPAATIPGFRDIASGVLSDYPYNPSPLYQTIEGMSKGLTAAAEDIAEGELPSKSAVKRVTRGLGAYYGVPGTYQAWNTMDHLIEVADEGEDLTLRELLFGPKKD